MFEPKEGTFLHNYMRWCEGIETNRYYDLWCGLWILSNAVGRGVVVDRPGAPVFLNLYVILVAESGTTRKSTAVNRAYDLLRQFDDPTRVDLAGKFTPGQLFKLATLQGQSHFAICASELVTVLGREAGTQGIPGLLTDLYDCPRERTRIAGTDRLIFHNSYPTLLGASTPSWLADAINPAIIEGGFTSRCLFVYQERPKRLIAWPDSPPQLEGLMCEQLRIARTRANEVGRINLNERARKHFVSWYNTRPTPLATDAFAQSFFAREDHHVLRVAGLLSINDGAYEVNVFHIRNALALIEHVKRSAGDLFSLSLHERRIMQGINRMIEVLITAGAAGIEKTPLLFKLRRHMSTTERNTIIALMQELEMVQVFELRGKVGAPTYLIRATELIRDPEVRQDFQDRVRALLS